MQEGRHCLQDSSWLPFEKVRNSRTRQASRSPSDCHIANDDELLQLSLNFRILKASLALGEFHELRNSVFSAIVMALSKTWTQKVNSWKELLSREVHKSSFLLLKLKNSIQVKVDFRVRLFARQYSFWNSWCDSLTEGSGDSVTEPLDSPKSKFSKV